MRMRNIGVLRRDCQCGSAYKSEKPAKFLLRPANVLA